MKIQQIRNATMKINYGGITFLLDPWLQDKGTGFSAKAVRKDRIGVKNPINDLPITPDEILAEVDHCLVTHIHPDHFTSDHLPNNIHIITQNAADQDTIQKMGFSNCDTFETDRIQIGSVTIIKTNAVHGSNIVASKAMGKGSGYVIQGESKTLYIAGDTVYCKCVESVIDQYSPDIIILNCCEATTPIGRLIMGLDDVEMVCKKAPAAKIIATHLDSVNHALVTSDDVRAFSKKLGLDQVLVPFNGEYLEF